MTGFAGIFRTIDGIVTITDSENDENKEFDFSMVLISYVKPRHPVFYGLWYDPEGHHAGELPDFYLFTAAHQDLVSYLISKVYSEHMLLDEIMKLVSYVSLQCIKIFPIGYDFEITTVSEKGIKKLSPGETKDIFHNSEKVDHKLKKTFSDFFI